MALRPARAAALALGAVLAAAPAPAFVAQTPAAGPARVEFPSGDGLTITADLYAPHPQTAPLLVLFHQAGSSRGEYREIAPRFVAMGFNCLAVDARSGGAVNGVPNETSRRAKAEGRPSGMLDAEQDLIAALRFARSRYARGPLLAVGSSYSASLVLRLAGQRPGLMDAVLAFSPGEYFREPPEGPVSIAHAARGIGVPVFVTSARSERQEWSGIYAAIPRGLRHAYVPEREGRHGASALWRGTNGQEGYWQAVRSFLNLRAPRVRA
ncbi:MAG TPA: alpha/beta hydrolase [Gemmatimonadales bacterium]|nr:alpha/beta hydrolase [Gemmatimonadales bacterium]